MVAPFLFLELLYNFSMGDEVKKIMFLQEFFFKRLYNHSARKRAENTYVQELVDEIKYKMDSCEDLFLWLRQNLDHYWVSLFPWTVEVNGFSDIPYLKVTFDYKLNEEGTLFVAHSNCSKNSLDIPDEYFNKNEVDLDVVAHFS